MPVTASDCRGAAQFLLCRNAKSRSLLKVLLKSPNNTKTLQAQILIILPQNFPPACEAELSYAFHKDLRLVIRKIMRDHLVNIRPACSADNVYKEVTHHVFTP